MRSRSQARARLDEQPKLVGVRGPAGEQQQAGHVAVLRRRADRTARGA